MASVSDYLNDVLYYGTTGIFGNLFGYKPSVELNPQYYSPEYNKPSTIDKAIDLGTIAVVVAGIYLISRWKK